MTFQVENFDKDGQLIEDIASVQVPDAIAVKILNVQEA